MKRRGESIDWLIVFVIMVVASTAARSDQEPLPYNPDPLADDFVLPMPRGLAMVFRPIFLSVQDSDAKSARLQVELGDSEAGCFAEAKRKATIAGSFRREINGRNEWLYYIGKFEVSERQWRALTDDDRAWRAGNYSDVPKRSVSKATIGLFVEKFNEWLTKNHADKLPREGQAVGALRLPTADEWEFAARGGSKVAPEVFHQRYPYPEAELGDYEWYGSYKSADGQPRAIGTRRANPLSLHDMVGNVREMMGEAFNIAGGFEGCTVMGSDYTTDKLAVGVRRQPGEPGETVGFRLLLGAKIRLSKEDREKIEQEAAELDLQNQARIENAAQAKEAERRKLEEEFRRSHEVRAKLEQLVRENDEKLRRSADDRAKSEQRIADLEGRVRDQKTTELERQKFRVERDSLKSELMVQVEARQKAEQELAALERTFSEHKKKYDPLGLEFSEVQRRAKEGDPKALIAVGWFLERDLANLSGAIQSYRQAAAKGGEEGWAHAERALRKQAQNRTTESKLELALFIEARNDWRRSKVAGKLEKEDLLVVACDQEKEALRLLKEAAAEGSPAARLKLAQAYWTGRGTVINPVLAMEQLEALSADSLKDSAIGAFQAQIAREKVEAEEIVAGRGRVTVESLIRLRPALKLLAIQSGVVKSGTVSEFFSPNQEFNPNARLFSRSDREALTATWQRLAADPCDSDALVELGYCYQIGIGVERDKNQALIHYQAAQNLGNPAGTFFVAMEYLSEGPLMNVPEGKRLLFSAVDQGLAQACYRLALSYQAGQLGGARLPFEKNPAECFRLFNRALDAGAIRAYGQLGAFYYNGEVPLAAGRTGRKEPAKALDFWKRGAKLGDPLSMKYLNHPDIKSNGIDTKN